MRVAACRVCKVLETRCPADEERIGELERQTNECRIVTEELDRKYDEVLLFHHHDALPTLLPPRMSYAHPSFVLLARSLAQTARRLAMAEVDVERAEARLEVAERYSYCALALRRTHAVACTSHTVHAGAVRVLRALSSSCFSIDLRSVAQLLVLLPTCCSTLFLL